MFPSTHWFGAVMSCRSWFPSVVRLAVDVTPAKIVRADATKTPMSSTTMSRVRSFVGTFDLEPDTSFTFGFPMYLSSKRACIIGFFVGV